MCNTMMNVATNVFTTTEAISVIEAEENVHEGEDITEMYHWYAQAITQLQCEAAVLTLVFVIRRWSCANVDSCLVPTVVT